MVLEYRRDPLSGAIVVIATERAKRPIHVARLRPICPFDRGYKEPGQETLRIPNSEKWIVKAVKNKFPIARPSERFSLDALQRKGATQAFGDHEVIIENWTHDKLFQDYTPEELHLALRAYKNRFLGLHDKKGVEYVYLFKNHGPRSGASLSHEHSQIIALPFIPQFVHRELENYARHKHAFNECLLCAQLRTQKANTLFENANFSAICPSFSRFPYEVWIIPKKHTRSFVNFNARQDVEFMALLAKTIKAVYRVSEDYVIAHHNAPSGLDMHYHAEIYPRPNIWGGIELGTGLIVNQVSDKDAIQTLKSGEMVLKK